MNPPSPPPAEAGPLPAPAETAGPQPDLSDSSPSPAGRTPPPGAVWASRVPGWTAVAALVMAVLGAWLAWSAQSRVHALEAELVRRQQSSADAAAEARVASQQAQELARETAAKMTLLDLRVAESSTSRAQIEELLQSVARSRDENVLADLESSLRVAMQHSALTGDAQPVLLALRQADERLSRHSQPELERVRRAIGVDAERVKAAAVADVAVLTARLDEVARLVDTLPLLAEPRQALGTRTRSTGLPASAAAGASAASASASATDDGLHWADWPARGRAWLAVVWDEVRSLVRITPIDQPEAVLLTPEQSFFLRENLKLRLLNARLALLSRQYEIAQADLRESRQALERYFDRRARAVQSAADLLKQVASQARDVKVPRPDATLAAIAAATAGR